MSIRSQLHIIRENLAALALFHGGRAEVCHDTNHYFEVLAKPGGLTLAVLWGGDQKRGLIEEAGVVDRTFKIGMTRARGQSFHSGDSLMVGAGGGLALYDLADQVRDWLRGIPFPAGTTEGQLDFNTANSLVSPPGFELDVLEFTLTIGTQLDAITSAGPVPPSSVARPIPMVLGSNFRIRDLAGGRRIDVISDEGTYLPMHLQTVDGTPTITLDPDDLTPNLKISPTTDGAIAIKCDDGLYYRVASVNVDGIPVLAVAASSEEAGLNARCVPGELPELQLADDQDAWCSVHAMLVDGENVFYLGEPV